MDPRGTKRGAEKTEVAEPRNKLPRPAPSLPTDPALYSGPFPFYRRPSELGCFSLDAQRQYHGDARALRYYSPPPTNGPGPNFDLRDGYPDRYQPRDEEVQERLDHLLCWLLEHRGRLEGGPGWLAEAIVTWRGHLTKLLTTPYERQEGWQLAASRFQGTLYLSEVETPNARAQRLARPPLLRELMYMGYKFEQYMCADKPGSSPDPSGEVNTNVAFCSVLRSRLGSHPLLFSGETFPTMKMFEYVRNDRDGWNPSVCMNFCAAFLSFAQSTVVQDDPRLVHLFSWEPGGPVTVSVHQDAPYAFLPIWYVEAMTQDLPSPPKTPSPK
ncbi:dom-3 homolog Z (C. elegans), isoform CRA_b [Homo sapiens]|nr:DOM3L [Homo sapiens]EAX03559.1 dom-3 homolog Z (C. elegans), isoform CRA_b [Homo sapiens]EAX03560.1 dom-3 homolog Z (C. elegans), isoform CRA_b [Homo sapiens]CAB89306.1 dJ34F7.6.1 (DOM-3 (C. elegans) homolog Z (isoform 1)) [Homo sapiens]